ncbi:hypothetical protein, partial [Paenibacillus sp. KS1]
MRLESIEVSNHKSIGNEFPVRVNLADIVVITGANDSGKTSFLEASYIGILHLLGYSTFNSKEFSIYNDSLHHIGFNAVDGKQLVKVYTKCTTEESSEIFDKIFNKGDLNRHLAILLEKGFAVTPDQVRNFINNTFILLKVPLSEAEVFFGYFSMFIDQVFWNDQVDKFFGFDGNPVEEFTSYLFETISSIANFEESIRSMTCMYLPSATREINYIEKEPEPGATERSDPGLELLQFFKKISSESGRRDGSYSSYLTYCRIVLPELDRIELIPHECNGRNEDLYLTWSRNGN